MGTDDDEEELDNSFKPSTLRRSFRRMRKAVKSVSSPLMSHRTGFGMTKAQSMSALPGGLMSIMTNVNDLCISPSEAASPYRKVGRTDLLVCWFESQYKDERLRDNKNRDQEVDIVTRLEKRTYTRHLARRILSLMT